MAQAARTRRELAEMMVGGDAPDYGLGPMTARTQAGRPNDTLEQGPPTTAEGLAQRILDYGPLPAKMAVEIAKQPYHAGVAQFEAYQDPSIANLTNAGVQTAMAVAAPAKALGILGAGYGAAAVKDSGVLDMNANAQEGAKPKLKPAQERALELQRQGGEIGLQQKAREAEIENQATEERNRIAREEAKRRADQAEYERAVNTAETRRDEIRATDKSFKDSSVGQVYEKTGGFAPMLAGVAGGAVHRLATGAGKGVMDKYVMPAVEGSALTFAGLNAPFVYDALNTPVKNPQREAMEAYSSELPPGHPRKELAAKEAAGMKETNPVADRAWGELTDPKGLARRGVTAVIEGAPAGIFGRNLPSASRRVVEGVGEIPGTLAAGYARGKGRAAEEGLKTAKTREELARQHLAATKAEADALTARESLQGARASAGEAAAVEAEAARRSGGQMGGTGQAAAAGKSELTPDAIQYLEKSRAGGPPPADGISRSATGQTSSGSAITQGDIPPLPVQGQGGNNLTLNLSPEVEKALTSGVGDIRKLAEALSERHALPPPTTTRELAERVVVPPKARGREGQLDPYNRPIDGPRGSASPADVARDIYMDASAAGRPTMGRGGNLTKDSFPDRVNQELAARTGVTDASGLSREQMHKRRVAADQEISDLAKREGISYRDAVQRYYDANPLIEASGVKKGMRRNVPQLAIAGAAGAAGASSYSGGDGIPRTPEELAHMLVMKQQGY